MESKRTRSVKRKDEAKGRVLKGALKRSRAILESSGEEEVDLDLPTEILENSKMAETLEAIREMSRVVADGMNKQMEGLNRQMELMRVREEANDERYRALVEGQQKYHREDTETLAAQFEKIRAEKEQARGRQTQRLPNFDGVMMEYDEWVEKAEAVAKCNDWDLTKLLENLPTTFTGQAKRSFDSLTAEDKSTKETLFNAMRLKLDPQAEKKNRELFMLAKKGPNESSMQFVDRLRQYIRRWGGDPTQDFAIEMLKYKTYDSLNSTDRKILNATVDHSEDLDKIIQKADAMTMTVQPGMIGAVTDTKQNSGEAKQNEGRQNQQGQGREQQGQRLLTCFQCGVQGHKKVDCWQYQQGNGQDWYQNNWQGPNANGGRQQYQQMRPPFQPGRPPFQPRRPPFQPMRPPFQMRPPQQREQQQMQRQPHQELGPFNNFMVNGQNDENVVPNGQGQQPQGERLLGQNIGGRDQPNAGQHLN